MNYNNIFGPVPSRRLGISLGVDLIPYKTCSFNCVYCECGETTNLTNIRNEYIKKEKIKRELETFLKKNPELDYITFSGSGEPTLHSKIGEIIDFLKKNFSEYNIALLTNGTLLEKDDNLISEIKNTDLIIPSLDAISADKFKKINRPLPDITAESIVKGLIQLRKNFKGNIWLEIFFISGINDTKKEINLLNQNIKKIKPDKIQLNSLDRPGSEKWVNKIKYRKMKNIANKLAADIPAETEIIFRKNNKDLKKFKKEINN